MRWLTAEGVIWSAAAAALNEPVRAASSKACSARRSRVVSVTSSGMRWSWSCRLSERLGRQGHQGGRSRLDLAIERGGLRQHAGDVETRRVELGLVEGIVGARRQALV